MSVCSFSITPPDRNLRFLWNKENYRIGPRHRRCAWVGPPRPSRDPTLRDGVCAESVGGGGQKR
uniref:Uncharacterized protein n=1 Tax=Physcomitrium patens TaxID=3218 RepID=A0A2K1IEH6_PHYPA|nr:hypothetical protein PHYPA_029830 [Physcomitrium patens]